MIDIGHIESGKPVTPQPAHHAPAAVTDHAAFRESFVASAGIKPATATIPKAVTVAPQAAGEEPPVAPTPKLATTIPVVIQSRETALPAPQPVEAEKPEEAVDAPAMHEAQVPAEPHAIKTVADTTPGKKAPRKTDSDAATPVAPAVDAPAIVPLVPVAIPLVAIPTVAAVVVETPAPAVPASGKGMKPGVIAAKPTPGDAKKPEAKPGVAPNEAATPASAAPMIPQPSTTIAPAAVVTPVSTVHAAPATVATSSKVSETSIVAAKVAEASAPAASTVTDLQTLVATSNVLEVGVATGTHGWLRVRAEMGQMGQVTASVVAASAGAAEGLHKELPAISAYLAGERVGVSSLVVNSAAASAGAQDAALSAGTQSGAGTSQRGQNASASAAASQPDDDLPELDFGVSAMSVPLAIQANGSGGWLSVRV